MESHAPRTISLGIAALLAPVLLLAPGCTPRADTSSPAAMAQQPQTASAAMGALTATPTAISVTTEAWTFESTPGRLIATPGYRIYTTSTNQALIERLPQFVEAAMQHYTTALTPLSRPPAPLDTYVMGNRPQWERLTQRMMGGDAGPYLQIARGGFSARGRAILWDIGRRDTFTITAHEGWHQYTQTTFQDALPIVYEEGIATYMEGFRWTDSDRTRPRFMPWANWERFGQLRDAVADGRTLSLGDLIREAPQDLMSRGSEGALDYYAQVWALTHFLLEGDEGRYREAMIRMIADAHDGRLRTTIRTQMGGRTASIHAMRRRGVDVLSLYTGVPTESLDAAYQKFMRDTVRTGAGQAISRGESPHARASAP